MFGRRVSVPIADLEAWTAQIRVAKLSMTSLHQSFEVAKARCAELEAENAMLKAKLAAARDDPSRCVDCGRAVGFGLFRCTDHPFIP